MVDQNKKSWFDGQINWATVIAVALAAGGAAKAVNTSYAEIVDRVTTLEQHDRAQDQRWEQRFQSLEKSQELQRVDTKEQLGNIAGDVKDIRKYLMERPQQQNLKGWTR